jgi:hypothetical protein
MSEHTPGPWRIDPKSLHAAPIVRGSGRVIAKVLYDMGSEDAEVMPNAHLIVAAPDLLAACEAVARATGLGDMTIAGQKVVAAIAKAKGKADA